MTRSLGQGYRSFLQEKQSWKIISTQTDTKQLSQGRPRVDATTTLAALFNLYTEYWKSHVFFQELILCDIKLKLYV